MKARQTTYKGIKMRSRLEASFAAHIDGLCTWAYEPRCYADETGQYLPDFHCQWTHEDHTFIEVKPRWSDVHAAAKSMEPVLSSMPGAHLAVYIPTGNWPDIDFHMAAARAGAGAWTFIDPNKPRTPPPSRPRPADAARAQLASTRGRPAPPPRPSATPPASTGPGRYDQAPGEPPGRYDSRPQPEPKSAIDALSAAFSGTEHVDRTRIEKLALQALSDVAGMNNELRVLLGDNANRESIASKIFEIRLLLGGHPGIDPRVHRGDIGHREITR